MPYYKATVEILLEVDSEGEACDAVAEAMRPLLREFTPADQPSSCWIDWRYAEGHPIPVPDSGDGFEYLP